MFAQNKNTLWTVDGFSCQNLRSRKEGLCNIALACDTEASQLHSSIDGVCVFEISNG